METLDSILHQPLRTQIAAFLAGAGEVTFSDLKRRLDVSDGNLDSHLKKMIAAGYVVVRKENSGGRAQSYFALSSGGQEALRKYVAALQQVLALGQASGDEAGSGAAVQLVP